MTQANLALVYHALFNKSGEPHRLDKSGEPHRLDDALEAVDGALEEFRKAKAPFYTEKAKRLQSEIFAARRK